LFAFLYESASRIKATARIAATAGKLDQPGTTARDLILFHMIAISIRTEPIIAVTIEPAAQRPPPDHA
jgi:hypothetical protein